MRFAWMAVVLAAALLVGCTTRPADDSIAVAAAANLAEAFEKIRAAFTEETGIEVVYSFGATTALAQQIEHGAPFDVFAAADVEHVDQLVAQGAVNAETDAIYARGIVALWAPRAEALGVRTLADLARPGVRFIAVANPNVAPYGAAAVEALRAAGLWETIEPKLVYANNVNQTRQFVQSGNAEAALTAYSLVLREPGLVLKLDPQLHKPVDQALGIVASSQKTAKAKQFTDFVLGPRGRAILAGYGYQLP